MLFLVKMFYVSQLKVDAGPPTQIITPQPLCRSFYQFMKSQYHTSNVGILATHDLLNKLQGIYQQNIVRGREGGRENDREREIEMRKERDRGRKDIKERS